MYLLLQILIMLDILFKSEKYSKDVTKNREEVKGARINSNKIEKLEREMNRQIVTAIKLRIIPEPNEVRTKAKDPIKINIEEIILATLSSGPCLFNIFNPKISIKIRENVINSLWLVCEKRPRIFDAKKQNVPKMK